MNSETGASSSNSVPPSSSPSVSQPPHSDDQREPVTPAHNGAYEAAPLATAIMAAPDGVQHPPSPALDEPPATPLADESETEQQKARHLAEHIPYALEVTHLSRSFGARKVLSDISFRLPRGEILVIMGGSGCGKSTLLRHIIGSLKPDSGSIRVLGEDVTSADGPTLVRIRKRFGMLFQTGALFNSLTVGENVALPLIESGVSESIATFVVRMKLELVGLTGFEELKPAQISGGMKKRVGLARALALDPELLFCDEPTAGLDPVMTAVVDKLTLDLVRKLQMSAVIVTHDMPSAFRIASRMVMLFEGHIIADGTPDEIRANPDARLQQFIRGEPDGPIPLKLSKDDYINMLTRPTAPPP